MWMIRSTPSPASAACSIAATSSTGIVINIMRDGKDDLLTELTAD